MEIIIFILAFVCVFAFLEIFLSVFKFFIILSGISLIIFGFIVFFENIRKLYVVRESMYIPAIMILVGIVVLKIFS